MKKLERIELGRMIECAEEYATRAREDRWARFDNEANDRIIAGLRSLEELPQTPITVYELHGAYQDMLDAGSALHAFTQERDETKERIRITRDWVTRIRRRGDDESEAMQAFEEARAEWRDVWGSDEFVTKEAELRSGYSIATNAYNATRSIHVYQCANIARAALLEDTRWAKYPTHYKRARVAIEEIAGAALLGTYCSVFVSESGNVSVNHSHRQYFTHPEHSDSMDIDIPYVAVGDRLMPDLVKLQEWHEGFSSRPRAYATYQQIRALCVDQPNALHCLEDLKRAYLAQANRITDPYRALGIATREFDRLHL